MPTYGYRCPSCSLEFDVWQRMTDEPAASCPNCGAAARRLFYPAGIVFKGSGFYKTDSRSSPGGGGAASKPAADGAASKDGSATKESPVPKAKTESGGSSPSSSPSSPASSD